MQQLYTIHRVSITYQNSTNTTTTIDNICTINGTTIYIHFLSEYGDLPLIEVLSNELIINGDNNTISNGIISINKYQSGTSVEYECSGVGKCDRNSGLCLCPPG